MPAAEPPIPVDFSEAFQTLPLPCFIMDEEGQVLFGNEKAGEIKRFVSEQNTLTLFPDEELVTMIATCIRQNAAFLLKNYCRIPSGDALRLVDVRLFPFSGRCGILLCESRPDEDAQEEKFIRFAATLAHEISNPVTGLYGAVQLLRRWNDNPETKPLLDILNREIQRISELTEKLRQFSGQRMVVPQAVNIHKPIADVCAFFSGTYSGIDIQCEFDPSLPEANISEDDVYRVLMNLLKNAAEAAQEKTVRIVLKTGYCQSWELPEPLGRTGDLFALLDVADYGSGITESHRESVFVPFFTTKKTGSGIGLSHCKETLEAAGGLIRLISSNQPTLFRIWLPLVANAS